MNSQNHVSGRAADHNFCCQNNFLIGNRIPLDLIHKKIAALVAELIGRLAYGGYGRHSHSGQIDIVKSHYRNILRDG